MQYKKKCEWCGQEFIAQKSNTRFCSKQCADHANKQRLRDWSISVVECHQDNVKKNQFKSDAVLTLKELSIYLGVSKTTAYRYVSEGIFPSIVVRGRIKVMKDAVDEIFKDAPPYRKKTVLHEEKAEPSSPSGKTGSSDGYTTAKEVAEKYGLSPAGADKLLKASGITLVKHRGKNYYPLSEVEALFRKREAASHPEITEWYTQRDIEEKYGLKPSTIWDLVSKSGIPSKREHGKAYYSKVHFDALRGHGSTDDLFYSVKQAMARYGQTQDQVYNVLRYNNIERILTGREVRFRRKDYDDCMKYVVKPSELNK